MLELPSGRLVRGRSLRRPLPADPAPAPAGPASVDPLSTADHGPAAGGRPLVLVPDLTLQLLARPEPLPWESVWVRWPDFRLPADPAGAREALVRAWRRSAAERVEVGCDGGRGRTGTALACLAVLDGVPAGEAVAYVRERYDPRAVETPGQRRFVQRFTA